MAIAGLSISALVSGFIFLNTTAEKSSHSLAAHAFAMETLEQVRAAKLDALAFPTVDEVVSANFPPRSAVIDESESGEKTWATNFTTITLVSSNPIVKAVRVDAVYTGPSGNLLTSSVVSYRAAETGQQNAIETAGPGSPSLPPPGGTGGTGSNDNKRASATPPPPPPPPPPLPPPSSDDDDDSDDEDDDSDDEDSDDEDSDDEDDD